jgi:oligopeptide/dipeptide ABC transporter ATP-binding protein
LRPDLLICDEVVSALDVSIQGQILNLLLDIRSRRRLSFLFIAHDLKAASYFCDRIAVMYRGEFMEEASAKDLYRTALHPYTRLLFSAATGAAAAPAPASSAPAEFKPPEAAPGGCAFAGRCPLAEERCFQEHPEMRDLHENTGEPAHRIRCFRVL